jgi:hypothetical protein
MVVASATFRTAGNGFHNVLPRAAIRKTAAEKRDGESTSWARRCGRLRLRLSQKQKLVIGLREPAEEIVCRARPSSSAPLNSTPSTLTADHLRAAIE